MTDGEGQKETDTSGTIVVKIGGSTLGSHDTTLHDLVKLQRQGVRAVVVHGGGKIISDWMAMQGVKPRFVRGLRVTDGPQHRHRGRRSHGSHQQEPRGVDG